jgi:hypothetical protein
MRPDLKNTAIFTAYDEHEPFDEACGEKNLLAAVLLSALADLKKGNEEARRATDFFLSESDDYIFSFHSICDHLKIAPHDVLVVAGLEPAE